MSEPTISEPIDQHYLPQFYLKGFTDPKSNMLHVYRPGDPYWSRQGVKKVACLPYLHSFKEEDGTYNHEIEEMFSKLETQFSAVLRKILARQTLDVQEQMTFAAFVMVMRVRVPSQVDHSNDFFTEVDGRAVEMMYHQYSKDPAYFEEKKKRMGKERGDDFYKDLTPEDFNPENITVKHNWHSTLAMLVDAAVRNAPIIYHMGWAFVEATPPDCFITSDFPFSLYNPKNTGSGIFGCPGLNQRHVELAFPLSKNIALFATWNDRGTRHYIPGSTRMVTQINIRTTMRSTRELISPSRSFSGLEHLTTVPKR